MSLLPDLSMNGKPMPVTIVTNPSIEDPASSRYIYSQMQASNIWNIVHNLNCYPSVSIVDTGGTTVIGDIQYISNNEIRISFSNAFSGKAYLN